MKITRILSLLLAASMLGAVACGDTGSSSTDTTTAAAADTTTAAAEEEYVYPDKDYEEYEFKFLNLEPLNWANVTIVPEETNGDLINDAQFERNTRIEERFNITIKEYNAAMADIQSQLINNVTAGDDAYDTYMVPMHLVNSVITEGYLTDLYSVNSLNMDKPWWDININKALELNGKLMFSSSDISFFPFEATMALFFNEDIFTDLGLEFPYDAVREGKWTIDALIKLAKAGASLNGDQGFETFDENGTSRYGLAAHTFVLSLVHGAGENYVELDGDKVVFNADSEKLFTIYEKFIDLAQPSTGAYYNNTEQLFEKFNAGRCMMYGETLGHLAKMRNVKAEFGVLPIPKYDEAQENYYSIIARWGTGMTTIPVTGEDIERTGVILDALAYDSYKNLLEPYYDTYLTQKGVRNEDSAEMLALIRSTRSAATDLSYYWTWDLADQIDSKLRAADGDVASLIASHKDTVIANVNKTLEAFK